MAGNNNNNPINIKPPSLNDLLSPDRFKINQDTLPDLHNPVQHLLETIESGAPQDVIKQVEEQVKQALSYSEAGKVSEQFNKLKEVAKQLVDARGAFQHLKLKDRVIPDNRDKPKAKPEHDKPEKGRSRHETKDFEVVKGRLVAAKDKKESEGYYANRMNSGQHVQADPRNAATRSVIERILNTFERLLIERFENGRPIVQEHPDGQPLLSEKSLAEWQQFFTSFGDRSVGRKLNLADVRDFLFRGLVQKGDKAIVVADVNLANGKVEKFIRFQVLDDLLQKLKTMQPGQSFSKDALQKLSGEELYVLALAVAQGGGFEFSPQAAKGKFLLGSTEEYTKRELGLSPPENPQHRAQKSARKGRGGLFSGSWKEREVWEEDLPQFVPWWSWGKIQRREKTESVRSIFYMALIIVSILAVLALTFKFLN